MMFPEMTVCDHEGYLATLLAMDRGVSVAKVLELPHKRPDPGYEGLRHPAKRPPGHLWCRDDLRVWLGTVGVRREGLPMWKLRRRRGTVRTAKAPE